MTSKVESKTTYRLGAPWPLPLYIGATANTFAQELRDGTKTQSDPATPISAQEAIELAKDATSRMAGMLAGIERWQTAPAPEPRALLDPIWQRGSSTLRPLAGSNSEGQPVLVVPSLINGPQILDLDDDVSLLGALARKGVRPIVLTWGEPTKTERHYDLSDYVSHRFIPAAKWLSEIEGITPHVLGYCLGGTLCLALDRQMSPKSRLCLIGAPWAFGQTGGIAAHLRNAQKGAPPEQTEATFRAIEDAFGVVPPHLFQFLFALLDPHQASRKFHRFAQYPGDVDAARRFVAVEDWLNGGAAIAVPAAKQLLVDWYCKDAPSLGNWRVDGQNVSPNRITAQTMLVTGSRDHIAPAEATLPLAREMPAAVNVTVPFGHVGMIASPRAQGPVAERVASFLAFGEVPT